MTSSPAPGSILTVVGGFPIIGIIIVVITSIMQRVIELVLWRRCCPLVPSDHACIVSSFELLLGDGEDATPGHILSTESLTSFFEAYRLSRSGATEAVVQQVDDF